MNIVLVQILNILYYTIKNSYEYLILEQNMDPKITILKNIKRRKPIVDRDPQFYNGYPLPSWIELSLIDTCNRSCSFCPK